MKKWIKLFLYGILITVLIGFIIFKPSMLSMAIYFLLVCGFGAYSAFTVVLKFITLSDGKVCKYMQSFFIFQIILSIGLIIYSIFGNSSEQMSHFTATIITDTIISIAIMLYITIKEK